MQTERRHKGEGRLAGGTFGFTRAPVEDDPRRDRRLLEAVARIAPGTELRAGIDDIIRSHEGALIVKGDPAELEFLFSGGIRLDQPFTPQLLYELAKMDGAIIINNGATKLVYANVQLMPDPVVGDRHAPPHRRARRAPDERTRDLDLAAA
jgi:diadenylate cyclase